VFWNVGRDRDRESDKFADEYADADGHCNTNRNRDSKSNT